MSQPPHSFDDAFARADALPGWLTRDQARVLHAEAGRVGAGPVVEIGSHLGRSTVVLASTGTRVVAVDPFPSDWRYGRTDTRDTFLGNLHAAGVAEQVDLRVASSSDVRRTWTGRVRLVYVDGKHDAFSCLSDLRWTRFQEEGDRFLVHDAFSSVGVTLALLLDTLVTRRHVYVDRTGSLARYRIGRPTLTDRARVLRELPWFVRNLGLKVLLRLRLHAVARRLGHGDTADPY